MAGEQSGKLEGHAALAGIKAGDIIAPFAQERDFNKEIREATYYKKVSRPDGNGVRLFIDCPIMGNDGLSENGRQMAPYLWDKGYDIKMRCQTWDGVEPNPYPFQLIPGFRQQGEMKYLSFWYDWADIYIVLLDLPWTISVTKFMNHFEKLIRSKEATIPGANSITKPLMFPIYNCDGDNIFKEWVDIINENSAGVGTHSEFGMNLFSSLGMNNLHLLRPGVDLQRYGFITEAEKKQQLKNILGLGDSFVVGTVAMNMFRKNIPLMMGIF